MTNNYKQLAGHLVDRMRKIASNDGMWSNPRDAEAAASAVTHILGVHDKIVEFAAKDSKSTAAVIEELKRMKPGTAEKLSDEKPSGDES